jgi:hypothetical protein
MYPGSHGYFFSWEEPGTAKLELDWSEAREFCRARCMELVSMETKRENKFVEDRLVKGTLDYNAVDSCHAHSPEHRPKTLSMEGEPRG